MALDLAVSILACSLACLFSSITATATNSAGPETQAVSPLANSTIVGQIINGSLANLTFIPSAHTIDQIKTLIALNPEHNASLARLDSIAHKSVTVDGRMLIAARETLRTARSFYGDSYDSGYSSGWGGNGGGYGGYGGYSGGGGGAYGYGGNKGWGGGYGRGHPVPVGVDNGLELVVLLKLLQDRDEFPMPAPAAAPAGGSTNNIATLGALTLLGLALINNLPTAG